MKLPLLIIIVSNLIATLLVIIAWINLIRANRNFEEAKRNFDAVERMHKSRYTPNLPHEWEKGDPDEGVL